MSTSSFTRFFSSPITRGTRRYSSFFSSKPGGGRYFNPAKPPKVVPPTSSNGKRNNKQIVDQPTSETVEATTTPTSSNESSPSPTHTHTHAPNPSQSVSADRHDISSKADSSSSTGLTSPRYTTTPPSYIHPMIGDKDFKLHQFFSLHRPLLLLSNPTSVFNGVAPGTSIFSQSAPLQVQDSNPPTSASGITEGGIATPEVSYEADAETARNLTRAMTMSRLGSVVEWEATLQRLGLESHTEVERAEMKEQLEKEFRDVVMDSVKRKRRKKMKKHKLKKRRRATLSERRKAR